MSARDHYHPAVKRALIKDGWTITDDPLRIRLQRSRNLYIDLGAERLLAAERGTEKIAVEIKSFLGQSDVRDLEDAVGQFVTRASWCATIQIACCTSPSPSRPDGPSSRKRSAKSC